MRARLITKFNSIKEWKNYGLNTHSLYLKNQHFKKWINKKEIYIFLHFKVKYGNDNSVKKTINLKEEVNSNELLKMIIEKRKENHKENADIFVFNKPIKSTNTLIEDGEALTYVSEGVMIFTFDKLKEYSRNFLRRRAKHEALHLLGINFHHEDTEVKGYKDDSHCNMQYSAPVKRLCRKCKDALVSFWKGIEYATKQQFVKNTMH
ncbi:hypothetical protein HYX00_02825 [Candidatus Woesearchaeota archaeon]|nr:hypothetical protein [Candidatus Woesearchaeota archaeon]